MMYVLIMLDWTRYDVRLTTGSDHLHLDRIGEVHKIVHKIVEGGLLLQRVPL